MEFIEAVARDLVASGVGAFYSTSGVAIQVNVRADDPGNSITTWVVLRQTGGVAFPLKTKEQYAFQCLVDSTTVVSAQTVARTVFDQLHERTAEVISGHKVLWMRAIALPQAVPLGPTDSKGYQFSVNFDAMLVKA